MENLFAILEKLTDIKDSQVEKIKKSGETGLPILAEKLEQALQHCEEVEKGYLDHHQVLNLSVISCPGIIIYVLRSIHPLLMSL